MAKQHHCKNQSMKKQLWTLTGHSSRCLPIVLALLVASGVTAQVTNKTSAVERSTAEKQTAAPFDNSLPIPPLEFDEKGELVIKAAATSSPNDFDFFVGRRRIFNTRLKSRLTHSNEWVKSTTVVEMQKIFTNSIVNIDKGSFEGPPPFEGMTVRLFNPQTKLWSLYWVNNILGTMDAPVVGSFENGVGHFFGKINWQGKKVIAVFRWDVRDKENPKWSQAFSPDNGTTWEWNWYMTYEKIN